jgi:hypothetical protein
MWMVDMRTPPGVEVAVLLILMLPSLCGGAAGVKGRRSHDRLCDDWAVLIRHG